MHQENGTLKSMLLAFVVATLMAVGGATGHIVNANSASTMGWDCDWFCNKDGQEDVPGVCDTAWTPMPTSCEGITDPGAGCQWTTHCDDDPVEEPV